MIKILCPAKINLGLYITGNRKDGYHNLSTVFYPIPLYDELEINIADEDDAPVYTLSADGVQVEGKEEDNLIIKALMTLRKEYSLPRVHINIVKHIPTGAGLGGGSSDCTCTLRALNEMMNLNIPKNRMTEIATKLGADCPFFVEAIPAYAEGIGEILTPIDLTLKGLWIALIKPDIHISTREAFAGINCAIPDELPYMTVRRPVKEWRNKLSNDFERNIFDNHHEIKDIKDKLYEKGALYASMSGSGSSVYGLFEKEPKGIGKLFPADFVMVKEMI